MLLCTNTQSRFAISGAQWQRGVNVVIAARDF
jgi:hypothetical protein